MNAPMPFMPPREPDELVRDVDAVARKLLELDGTAFNAMFDALTGWSVMPPRQRFSVLASRIRAFDTEAQGRAAAIDVELQTLAMVPPETPHPSPDGTAIPTGMYVQQLQQELEQLVTAVLPNPGLAFFQSLAGIDARKTAELSKEYARGLKTYGGAI